MTTVLNVELKLTKEEKEKIVNECLDILNDRLVEELEKIKAEILDYELYDSGDANPDRAFEVMQDLSIKIIDNHIKELKGE